MIALASVIAGLGLLQSSLTPNVPAKLLAPAPAADKIVATVEGKPIKASEIQSYLWQWRGSEVTEELVSLLAVREYAKKNEVTVSPAEIEGRLTEQLAKAEKEKKASQTDQTPGLSAQDSFFRSGFPLSRLYLRAEFELTLDKLALKKFDKTKFYRVATAIFRPSGDAATAVSAAATKANRDYAKLKAGTAWADVLRDSGAVQQQMANLGDIGWKRIEAFPESLQPTLLKTPAGSYTAPVQTPAGFQIFKVLARGDKAQGAELKALQDQYLTYSRNEILSDIRKTIKIERFLPAQEPAYAN